MKSGADIGVLPATSNNKEHSDYKLYAANGTEIETFVIKIFNLNVGLRRNFQFPFVIAKVTKGKLGANLLN